jgi:hypothetical protein
MEFLGGLPKRSNFYCLPGRAGGTPVWIRKTAVSVCFTRNVLWLRDMMKISE